MSAPDEAAPSNKGETIEPRNWGNRTFNDAQQKALDDIRNNARRQRPFIEDLSDSGEEEQQPLWSAASASDGARHDGHTGDVDSGKMLQPLSEGDHTLQRMDHELVSNSRAPQSNFFQNAQHMEISNSTFISHVHTMPRQPQELSAFRKIYRGDIEVEHVHTDRVTKIWSKNGDEWVLKGKVRRIMASATIHPYRQKMTVTLYEGNVHAKEAWINDIRMHSHIWQPSILQLYATMSSPGIYATISHRDVISTTELWGIHAGDPLSRAKLRIKLSSLVTAPRRLLSKYQQRHERSQRRRTHAFHWQPTAILALFLLIPTLATLSLAALSFVDILGRDLVLVLGELLALRCYHLLRTGHHFFESEHSKGPQIHRVVVLGPFRRPVDLFLVSSSTVDDALHELRRRRLIPQLKCITTT
uniref:Uncharacterized protein n=1 Tax=Mycena chlorophos TaxID=658473 RepID=A0ABQ0L3U0_MYCCL|nr:predicted protein [Mycena chlorophos]